MTIQSERSLKVEFAISEHLKEQEFLYIRKKKEYMRKHGLREIKINKSYTALES